MATRLIKNSFVKDVLKEHSGASQVSTEALERVDELFQEFLVKVATAAAASLEKDERSTTFLKKSATEIFASQSPLKAG